MWMLHLLPTDFLELVVNALLIGGAIATFLSFFVIHRILLRWPGLCAYNLFLQILSITALVAGVYFKGGYETEMLWREKVAEAERKQHEAEARSQEVNTVVETKIVTQTRVIKEKGQDIIKYVDREIEKIVLAPDDKGRCSIVSREVVDIHNEAANLNKAVQNGNQAIKK